LESKRFSGIEMIVKPTEITITDAINLAVQTQGAGIDLTLRAVERFVGAGVIDFDNSRREIPPTEAIQWIEPSGAYLADNGDVKYAGDLHNWAFVELEPGAYIAKYNEIVEVPKDALGIVLPRSSMMRSGATVCSAVWDPGYCGRGLGLMQVMNPIKLYRNARICQIFFIRLEGLSERLYNGKYQGEGK
jgi:dUTP pyrophosphatase